MNFEEFQQSTKHEYPSPGKNYVFPALQIQAGVGKIAERIKNASEKGGLTARDEAPMIKAMREALEGMANLCSEMGIELNYVASNQEVNKS